jgi:hypothetical protein
VKLGLCSLLHDSLNHNTTARIPEPLFVECAVVIEGTVEMVLRKSSFQKLVQNSEKANFAFLSSLKHSNR